MEVRSHADGAARSLHQPITNAELSPERPATEEPHERNNINRTAYQEGRQGPPTVPSIRFQVASAGSTPTEPTCDCPSCSSPRDRSATMSASTMPPPHPQASPPSSVSQQTQETRLEEQAQQKEVTDASTSKQLQDVPVPVQEKASDMKLQESPAPTKDNHSSSSHEHPPPRPLKDRPSASRVASGATTIHLEAPLPTLPRDDRNDGVQALRRARTYDASSPLYNHRPLAPSRRQSGIDWVVPYEVDEKRASSFSQSRRTRLSIAERLQPTLDLAREAREKFAKKAEHTKYLQNAAIGLQVLLGSLTTGLSAVATTGRQMAVQTTILGGLTTVVASYLAKTRGSNEPELSRTRAKDLDKFIRTLTAFLLDFGHSDDPMYDKAVEQMRSEFEELLGNGSVENVPGGEPKSKV